MTTDSLLNSPATAIPLRETILEALRKPELARVFGQSLLTDAPVIDVDPEASDAFHSAMNVHLHNLKTTHPWPARIFGKRSKPEPFSYRLAFRFYRARSRWTVGTGLEAHYKHICAMADLKQSQVRLDGAAIRLSRVQSALSSSIQQMTDQIANLDDLVQRTISLLENDPEIAGLKVTQREGFDLFSGRISALLTRLVITRQQLLQAQTAEATVIRRLDQYFRFKDVFMPAYDQQLSLLAEASPRQAYRHYRRLHKSLHLEF